ncbi:MAG: alginate export family protein [Prosthecobacter sp.]|uniref:alginate export family protein n=1 Tax=Prosthecobacter sp. TaxID=1965333 RepID=UPI003BAF0338
MKKTLSTRTLDQRFLTQALGLLLLTATAAFAAEVESKKLTRGTYYQNPLSYSTTRDPDPPKYVRNVSELGVDSLLNVKWLDVGLDYRFRYEYRDNDLRRAQKGVDQPLLHRTRAYIGIKDILDPFRFAFEMQDSRRENSHYARDNRDVNEFEIIRAYVELYFKDLFGHDAIGNARPLSIRYGIHNFEFLDRRLIGNNQWRNTANAFQGFHASLGQESSDWQLDLLAVQPLNRLLYQMDRPVEQQWMYAAIGHLRQWSDIITLEPYYLALHQSAYRGVAERMVHNPGLRGYGIIGATGFDYDASMNYQFGQNGTSKVRAYAGTVEVGYTLSSNPWKPRVSLFYGYAGGDRNPNDSTDNRFERFFGFGRPWSANDYIVFENISTPKVRVELKPRHNLRVDFGYSYYWLASGTDRFNAANNARDRTGASGNFLGQEFDIRARYTWDAKTEFTIGYSYFAAGGFVERQLQRPSTNFAYFEFSHRFF